MLKKIIVKYMYNKHFTPLKILELVKMGQINILFLLYE